VPSGGSGGASGGGGTSLHAEQHYEYHRPLVVGDVLHARGRRGDEWEKQGRSGTLKFTELITEYLDEHDEVVITARTVAVLTEGPT
jgi:acyl-CoA thioesterase FadM